MDGSQKHYTEQKRTSIKSTSYMIPDTMLLNDLKKISL